jgi:hypothetical protein
MILEMSRQTSAFANAADQSWQSGGSPKIKDGAGDGSRNGRASRNEPRE